MKKQLLLVLPFIIISSFVYAKKDTARVVNDSDNTVHIFFTADGCRTTSKWDAPVEKRNWVGAVCSEHKNVASKASVSYEWKWGESTRNVAVYDTKTGDFYLSTPKMVKQRRNQGAPVHFPSDFAKEPYVQE